MAKKQVKADNKKEEKIEPVKVLIPSIQVNHYKANICAETCPYLQDSYMSMKCALFGQLAIASPVPAKACRSIHCISFCKIVECLPEPKKLDEIKEHFVFTAITSLEI